jgi:hypothetical protein
MKVRAKFKGKKRPAEDKKQTGLEDEQAMEIHNDLTRKNLRKKRSYDSLGKAINKHLLKKAKR